MLVDFDIEGILLDAGWLLDFRKWFRNDAAPDIITSHAMNSGLKSEQVPHGHSKIVKSLSIERTGGFKIPANQVIEERGIERASRRDNPQRACRLRDVGGHYPQSRTRRLRMSEGCRQNESCRM